MPITHFVRRVLASGLMAAAAAHSHAQSAPPIKPGLWQVQIQREGDGGAAMPDMGEHLKNMPPAQRKQLEAMMKARGADISGGPGQMKVCHSKESLAQGAWQGDQARCKTEVTQRSVQNWKWRSVCTQPAVESEGEAVFGSADSYVVKSSTTMAVQGQRQTVKSTLNAKWLGADCGDVKPMLGPKKPG